MERYFSKVSSNLSKLNLASQNSFTLEEENTNELEQGQQSIGDNLNFLYFDSGKRQLLYY